MVCSKVSGTAEPNPIFEYILISENNFESSPKNIAWSSVILPLWLSGLSVSAFTAPTLPIALGVVYRRHRQAGQARVTDLMAAPAPYGEIGGAERMAPSDCALKNVGTRKSPTYLARRLATAGLQLAALMMTHTRKIRRFTRAKLTPFLFFAVHQNCSSPAAIASRRRGNDLGTMITYLRRATGDVSGNNGLSATLNYLRRAAGNGRAQR